jgi:hypothetical protein
MNPLADSYLSLNSNIHSLESYNRFKVSGVSVQVSGIWVNILIAGGIVWERYDTRGL